MQEEPSQRRQSIYFDFNGYKIRTSIYPNISYGDALKIEGESDQDGFVSFPNIEKVGQSSGFQSQLFSFRSKIEDKINKFFQKAAEDADLIEQEQMAAQPQAQEGFAAPEQQQVQPQAPVSPPAPTGFINQPQTPNTQSPITANALSTGNPVIQ